MPDFMSKHGRQTGVVPADGKDRRVNAHFAARQAKSIRLFAVENDKFPLGVRQVLAGDTGDTLAHSFHGCVRRGILTDGRILFELVEA